MPIANLLDRLFGMKARATLLSALAISVVFAPFLAVAAVKLPEAPAGYAPKLTIYLAKGEANSCGQGCDRWIAVEGRVDADAASRMRQFLRGVKDTQRPIYFHSPGGDVRQAFAIGRLLRARKAVGRVGRTIVAACPAGSQVDDACLKVKTAGGEVQAELATSRSMCNSACGYLFLGATTREVAPDAVVGVHHSKLILEIRGHPSARQRAEFVARSSDRADRETSSYVEAMGISRDLAGLIETVKFESMHVLTRPELYRFRIDSRDLAETAWTLEAGTRPFIRKIALAKKPDGSFRMMQWQLVCEGKGRARFMFLREFDQAAAGTGSVAVLDLAIRPAFGTRPLRLGAYEIWSAIMTPETVKSLIAMPGLRMAENTSTQDGRTTEIISEINSRGFEGAWTRLSATCEVPAGSTAGAIGSPDVATAPAP
jgi:hypothetical protein